MAIISSHILDSVHGSSASGIRVQCQKMVNRNGDHLVFEVEANEEGRIMEEVSFEDSGEQFYQLIFFSDEYFRKKMAERYSGRQIVREIVIRLVLPDPEIRYHVPVIIGPHSNTFWWSE